jgi:hypothetical protein
MLSPPVGPQTLRQSVQVLIAEMHAGGTQSCYLARKIIHNKMDAIPASSFGASAIMHGPPG